MNANNNNNNHNRHRIVNRGQRVMFPRESLRRRRSPSVNTAIEYSEAEAVSRKYMTASINNRLCRLSINHSKDSLNNPIFPDDNMATLRYGEQATLLEEARQQLKMIVNGCTTLLSDVSERKVELEEEAKRLKAMELILARTTTADRKCNEIV